MADEIGNRKWTKSGMADDIVTRIRAEAKKQTTLGQAFDMLHVADEIEQLRLKLHTTQTHLYQTLIALNDLTAIPTHPQHQHHARTTLANILKQRHLTITAIRPHTPNTHGT